MRANIALSAGTLLVLAAASVSIGACAAKQESEFADTPNPPDAGPPPPGSFASDDAGADAEVGPVSCDPAIPPSFTPSWSAPVNVSDCSSAQIDDYWTSCLEDPSTTEGDGACAAWKASNAACAACAEPPGATGPIQWHQDRMYYTLNVAACIALRQGEGGEGSCGEAYNAAVQCARVSCEGCFAAGGDFEQFRECQRGVATEGVCGSYETIQSSACQGIRDPAATTLDCFNDGVESQEAHFKRVVSVACGGG